MKEFKKMKDVGKEYMNKQEEWNKAHDSALIIAWCMGLALVMIVLALVFIPQ